MEAKKLLLQKHIQTDYTLYKLSKLKSAASREVVSVTCIRDDEKRGGGISVEGTDPTAASAPPITLADDTTRTPTRSSLYVSCNYNVFEKTLHIDLWQIDS